MKERSPLTDIERTEFHIQYSRDLLNNKDGIRDKLVETEFKNFYESSKRYFQGNGLDMWSKEFMDKYTNKPVKILKEIIWKIINEENDRYMKNLEEDLTRPDRDAPMGVRQDEGTAQFYWYYGINYMDYYNNPEKGCEELGKAIAERRFQEQSA